MKTENLINDNIARIFKMNSALIITPELRVARAKTQLMIFSPFAGSVTLQLQTLSSEYINTMATDGKSIWWNKDFVRTITDKQIQGVLVHEAYHVVLFHPMRKGHRNRKKFNIACDYVVNQIVIDEGFDLPGKYYIDEKYRNMTAEQVYDLLPDDYEDEEIKVGPIRNYPGTAKEGEFETQIIINSAAALAKKEGSLPGWASDYIETMQKPKVDWRTVLRRLLGGEIPDDYSWKKPNRKMLAVHDIYYPGTSKTGVGHLGLGWDISGSVSLKEQELFLGGLNDIITSMGSQSVTVIKCDTRVTGVEEFGPNEPVHEIKNITRGGTAFEPVFKYIKDHQMHFDNFIYMTDGGGNSSFDKSLQIPTIWCTTHATEFAFGEVIKLELDISNTN